MWQQQAYAIMLYHLQGVTEIIFLKQTGRQ